MKGDSPLITLPIAAVIGTVIMVGMPLVARMQPKPPDDPWLKIRPPTYESGGQVLHNGKPIKGAVVTFVSTFENPHRTYSSTGVTNSEGRFLLNAFRGQIGAPAGPQKISILYMIPTGKILYDPYFESEPLELEEGEEPPHNEQELCYPEDPGIPEMTSGIPARYSDPETSGLTETITPNGPNQFVLKVFGDAEPPDPRQNAYYYDDEYEYDAEEGALAQPADASQAHEETGPPADASAETGSVDLPTDEVATGPEDAA